VFLDKLKDFDDGFFTYKKYILVWDHSGVQSKNNAYHNVNKDQNRVTDTLIWNLIDIVVCVGFALYSSTNITMYYS
jgi:hypothetical protein